MKKLIAALFAAILTTAGLVVVSSTPASAACTQYVCVRTTAAKPANQTVTQGKKPKKLKVNIGTRGSVKAKGVVTVTVKGPGVNKTIRANYNGKPLNLNLPNLKKPGKYKVTITFKGASGFSDSKTTSTITVKKKPKKGKKG